jgi:hypothetical protein
MRFLLALLCALAFAAPVPATVYYVSGDGSDSNAGTSTGAPWRTIAKVNAYTFASGDTVKFNRGHQWREQLAVPRSGLVLTAYGTGELPIINGADSTASWTSLGSNRWRARVTGAYGGDIPVVFFSGERGTECSTAASVDATREWHYDTGTLYLTVYSATNPTASVEYGMRYYGVYANWGANRDSVTVSYLHIKQAVGKNVCASGSNDAWTVEYVTAHHNGPVTNDGRLGIYMEGNGSTVRHCTVYEAGGNGIEAAGDDYLIERNTVYDCHHHCIDSKGDHYTGDGGDLIGRGGIIRYNLCYNTAAMPAGSTNGIYLGYLTASEYVRNARVYGNTVYNIRGSGILVNTTNTDSVYVYHNTLSGCTSYGLWVDIGTKKAWVWNNVAYNGGTAAACIANTSNKTVDYNNWYTASGTLVSAGGTAYTAAQWATYKSATGFDAHSVATDPLWRDRAGYDFALTASSPGLNTGTTISGYTADTALRAVPTGIGPDMGAYEFAGAGSQTCYYVAKDGADTNPGTEAAPLLTVGALNALSFAFGDSVRFKAGGTWTDAGLTLDAAHMFVGSYGVGATPVLDGTFTLADGLTVTAGTTVSGIAVRRFTRYGVYGSGVDSVTVRNCTLDSLGTTATVPSAIYAGSGSDVWTVTGNTISDCASSGGDGYGVRCGDTYSGGTRAAMSATVSNNTITGTPYGIALFYGSTGASVYSNQIDGGAVGIYSVGSAATGNLLQSNTITDATTYGVFLGGRNTLKYSLLTGCATGVYVQGVTAADKNNFDVGDNNLIHNNTLYGNTVGLSFNNTGDTVDSCRVQNNLVIEGETAVRFAATQADSSLNAIDYNGYFTNVPAAGGYFDHGAGNESVGDWQTATGYDTHAVTDDPRFLDPANGDYTLHPLSPAVNAGSLTGIAGGVGKIVGTGIDLGAYEEATGGVSRSRDKKAVGGLHVPLYKDGVDIHLYIHK